MGDETLISDLVAQAEALIDRGIEPELETICAQAPHLLAEVQNRLRKLCAIRSLSDPPPIPSQSPSIHALASRHGYELIREVGGGNMGIVYEARDRFGRTVALKTLNRPDPARLAYLKQEFEALVGIRHENLVAIFNQVSDGDHWFYVMEYVPGRHFLDHVRSARSVSGTEIETTEALPLFPSLRPVLLQLALGIHALHRAHRLHRDIKSSNVLVTKDCRVKLLDYGLVAELDPSDAYAQWGLAGTVGYMSPEQCGTQPLSPASDWYSFGVLMYEALTGKLPFQGPLLDVMQRKQTEEPLPPIAIDPRIPADLNDLCKLLLRIDPAARPTGEDVLRGLGAISLPIPSAPEEFVLGRERHLAELHAAAKSVRQSLAPIVVELHGPSGMGKSTLARRFLQETQANENAVVLSGTCYEQSAVPYKAFDSLISALCRHLRRLPRERAEALLPVHMAELTRLFPIFGRLELVAEAPPLREDDPHEIRRRAHQALRELLHRMSQRVPLVLFVDDLQWGDSESGSLLNALLRQPAAPPILYLAGYRRGDGAASSFIHLLREADVTRRDLPVDALTEEEASELAGTLLGAGFPDQAQAIARESGGSPLLVHELVQFFKTGTDTHALTLDTVLRRRAARLADEPRRLLEIVAVSAGPIDPDTASRAAELPLDRQPGALDELITEKFVRTVTSGETHRIEAYHDRIREAIAGSLSPEVRENYHYRLAIAHKASSDVGPEILSYHFDRAAKADLAAPYHIEAAAQSSSALAFDSEAEHIRQALDAVPPEDPRRKGWLLLLAAALAHGGRGREAAEAFTLAATISTGTDAVLYRQRAAEQLARCGLYDEGIAALKDVLARVGIKMPATAAAQFRSILWMRFRTAIRGFRFKERVDPVAVGDSLKIDVCRWAAAMGGQVDAIQGFWFHYRGLLLALRVGEPSSVAQALAREAILGRPIRGQSAERIEHLNGIALGIATRLADSALRSETVGPILMYKAVAYLVMGEFRRAVEESGPAFEALSRCSGVSASYQRSAVRMFEASAHLYLGNLRRFREMYERDCRSHEERGNVRGAIVLTLSNRAYHLPLAEDRPLEARRMIRETIERWGRKCDQSGPNLLHLYAWFGEMDVSLYEGQMEQGWLHCEQLWRQVNRRSFAQPWLLRVLTNYARARCAMAMALSCIDRGDRLQARSFAREAVRMARKLEYHSGTIVGPPHGWLIRAAIAHQRGNESQAIAYLERAEVAFEKSGMALHLASARRRRGELLGGDTGRGMIAVVDADLVERGIQNPARFAAMYTPGIRTGNAKK